MQGKKLNFVLMSNTFILHTDLHLGLQGIARVYRGLQGYTRVWKGLQGFTGDYKDL